MDKYSRLIHLLLFVSFWQIAVAWITATCAKQPQFTAAILHKSNLRGVTQNSNNSITDNFTTIICKYWFSVENIITTFITNSDTSNIGLDLLRTWTLASTARSTDCSEIKIENKIQKTSCENIRTKPKQTTENTVQTMLSIYKYQMNSSCNKQACQFYVNMI